MANLKNKKGLIRRIWGDSEPEKQLQQCAQQRYPVMLVARRRYQEPVGIYSGPLCEDKWTLFFLYHSFQESNLGKERTSVRFMDLPLNQVKVGHFDLKTINSGQEEIPKRKPWCYNQKEEKHPGLLNMK